MIGKRLGDLVVGVVVVYYLIATTCVLTSLGGGGSMECNSKGTNCSCPLSPITAMYKDPADPTCIWYYLCHMGVPFRKKCQVRFAFHPIKQLCLPRSEVPFNVCKPAVDCTKDGYVADPFDCTKYYLCFYRQSYHYGCKYDFYYDGPKGRCLLNKTHANTCEALTLVPENLKNNRI